MYNCVDVNFSNTLERHTAYVHRQRLFKRGIDRPNRSSRSDVKQLYKHTYIVAKIDCCSSIDHYKQSIDAWN